MDTEMSISKLKIMLTDNGGRRLGIDNRKFSYTNHLPDKRKHEDRRSGVDRRCVLDRRQDTDRRSGIERRAAFAKALVI